MGRLLAAKCNNCGYGISKLHFGGGMRNYRTYFGYPVINMDTDEISMANIFDKENIIKRKDNILFYDSESLINISAIKNKDILKYGKEFLYCGKIYFCPKCKKSSLEFYYHGNWD